MSAAGAPPAEDVLHDVVQTAAWSGMINHLVGEEWALAQFTAETGVRVPTRARSALDALIDRACGHGADAELRAFGDSFIRWATRVHWGEDNITPTIRGVLDSLTPTEAI